MYKQWSLMFKFTWLLKNWAENYHPIIQLSSDSDSADNSWPHLPHSTGIDHRFTFMTQPTNFGQHTITLVTCDIDSCWLMIHHRNAA